MPDGTCHVPKQMNAALIGLLGVVAGGLLGGLATYWVERRNRHDDALEAAGLIVLELQAAAFVRRPL